MTVDWLDSVVDQYASSPLIMTAPIPQNSPQPYWTAMNTTRSANVSVLNAMTGPEVIQRITQQHHTLFFNIIC